MTLPRVSGMEDSPIWRDAGVRRGLSALSISKHNTAIHGPSSRIGRPALPSERFAYSKDRSRRPRAPVNEDHTQVFRQDWKDGQREVETTVDPSLRGCPSESQINVQVHDEARGMKQDFTFERNVLLQRMKYFDRYFRDCQLACQDVEISVHCDVQVFAWISLYLAPDGSQKIDLEPHMAVSILVAAHFLEIPELLELCLDYVGANLKEVLSLGIDLSCLGSELIGALAKRISVFKLDDLQIVDEDSLESLYQAKVAELFLSSDPLQLCDRCGVLFPGHLVGVLDCRETGGNFSFERQCASRHRPRQDWSVRELLHFLTRSGYNWQQIFWQCWVSQVHFRCSDCGLRFTGVEMAMCCHHPMQATESLDADGSSVRFFPCCGEAAPVWRSHQKGKGCHLRTHVVEDREGCQEDVKLLLRHCDAIVSATEVQILLLKALRAQNCVPVNQGVSYHPYLLHPLRRRQEDNSGIRSSSVSDEWQLDLQLEEDHSRMLGLVDWVAENLRHSKA